MLREKYQDIRRTLQDTVAKNHVILRYFYRFLPEGSEKLGCYAGVI